MRGSSVTPQCVSRSFAVVVLAVAAWTATGNAWAAAASPAVTVFPIPGSRYSRPETQISFRGAAGGAIGPVTVVGSATGLHAGHVEVDSDRDGASFLPTKRFIAGETVTVSTHLPVLGAQNGKFSFRIANVAPLITCASLPAIPVARPGDIQHFRSRPDLRPASVIVTADRAPVSNGDIFLGPQNGPVQNGPMILGPHGKLVWFMPIPVSRNIYANDVRVADLQGQQVLTWWQGCRASLGIGRGDDIIVNRAYQRIDTVKAGNGLDADSHEFLLTPTGDAYITANSPVRVPGLPGTTIDWVVQEIDVRTGLVLFEWHALDHVPPTASYFGPPDPYHMNSISLTPDGNLLVSMRNTSAVYEIDRGTGRVLWTLGGKYSSFRMGAGTRTWEQHDAVAQPDGTVTVFDNGGGPPFLRSQSRGIHERLDTRTMTATLIREYDHSPPQSSFFEGGVQLLADGDAFLGWGGQPFFSEYDATGKQVFDAHFNAPIRSYRAFRFKWRGQPLTRPALAVSSGAGLSIALYGSWNGATDVGAWRVLAGPQIHALKPFATAPKVGFETVIRVRTTARYVAVQALDVNGRTLGTSRATRVPTRTHGRRSIAVVLSSNRWSLLAAAFGPPHEIGIGGAALWAARQE